MRHPMPLVLVPLALGLLACSSHSTPQASTHAAPSESQSGPLLVHIPGEVRSFAAAPKKVSPNGRATIALLAQGHNAFVGKLELSPHAKVPEHQDPTEEYIHVLSGHAQMTMDGTLYDIEPGSTIYMPAMARVSVQNGAEPLVGLQVFAGPTPSRKYDTWSDLKPTP